MSTMSAQSIPYCEMTGDRVTELKETIDAFDYDTFGEGWWPHWPTNRKSLVEAKDELKEAVDRLVELDNELVDATVHTVHDPNMKLPMLVVSSTETPDELRTWEAFYVLSTCPYLAGRLRLWAIEDAMKKGHVNGGDPRTVFLETLDHIQKFVYSMHSFLAMYEQGVKVYGDLNHIRDAFSNDAVGHVAFASDNIRKLMDCAFSVIPPPKKD